MLDLVSGLWRSFVAIVGILGVVMAAYGLAAGILDDQADNPIEVIVSIPEKALVEFPTQLGEALASLEDLDKVLAALDKYLEEKGK